MPRATLHSSWFPTASAPRFAVGARTVNPNHPSRLRLALSPCGESVETAGGRVVTMTGTGSSNWELGKG